MKIDRVGHSPGDLIQFYEEGLTSLGAVCDRTWHDRLEVIAEDRAAMLWNTDGALHEIELQFTPADSTAARDAAREVFPGCPLTFKLSETLRGGLLSLERFVLPDNSPPRPPDASVAEKNWRAQFTETTRWLIASPWKPDFHYSLLALTRCEIQAIDQHWSLHRVIISLADGELDDALAQEITFHQTPNKSETEIIWPQPNPDEWRQLLEKALTQELSEEMTRIRKRQEHSLRRELERIDDYFENYERELTATAQRSANSTAKIKLTDRLAAAKAEHNRRRADQVARHEIRVCPHMDAFVLIAEKAWRVRLQVHQAREAHEMDVLFVPRLRQWKVLSSST